jgi:SAM-dependent methyltransferase
MSACYDFCVELSPEHTVDQPGANTAAAVQAHVAMLESRVFQTESKWPHFRLLLRNLDEWSRLLPPEATVVSLERTLLYGGVSLFAPLFGRQRFISVDSSPQSADERGSYNAGMIDDERCIRVPFTVRAPIDATGLESGVADLVTIPNLVHHVGDQDRLFAEIARLLKPGGTAYVFEPILRELHQMPDDYLRYTPFGMAAELKRAGLEPGPYELEGGPFSAIAYCWTQALEYFPEAEREQRRRWFYEEHFPQLMQWDELHRDNLVRKHTQFPVSFSIVARKPL